MDDKVQVREVETLMEYEVSDEQRGVFEKSLGDKIAELIDDAFKQGAPVEDAVGAVGEILYSLVSHVTLADEGKVLSLVLEPFECGCLLIQVRQGTPIFNVDDAAGCVPN